MDRRWVTGERQGRCPIIISQADVWGSWSVLSTAQDPEELGKVGRDLIGEPRRNKGVQAQTLGKFRSCCKEVCDQGLCPWYSEAPQEFGKFQMEVGKFPVDLMG